MGALIPLALSLVPEIARWLGGARAGTVATQVTDVVRSVTGTDNPEAARAVLADPTKAAELRVQLARIAAEQEAAQRQAELEMFRAQLSDVANARAQTTSLAQAGSSIAWAPTLVSGIITVGFFFCVVLLFRLDRQLDDMQAALINTLFGALVIAFGQVCNYWLGSSAGSKRSGDAFRDLANTTLARAAAPPPPAPPQPAAAPAVAIASTDPVTINQPVRPAGNAAAGGSVIVTGPSTAVASPSGPDATADTLNEASLQQARANRPGVSVVVAPPPTTPQAEPSAAVAAPAPAAPPSAAAPAAAPAPAARPKAARLTPEDIERTAQSIGLEPALVKAVLTLETGRSGGFLSDGSGRPRILFEAHLFHQATGGRFTASHPSISSPVWNRALYKLGAAEYARLDLASALDRRAALSSASWGLLQILGSNHRNCGFPDVESFVTAMHESEARHLEAFASFITKEGMTPLLRAKDWAGFARRYNGPGFAANAYDVKLAAAYAAASGAPEPDSPIKGMLRIGSHGEKVKAVQQALAGLGLLAVADGEFGQATQIAVQQFQAMKGLDPDGVVGPLTLAALGLPD
ncbi:N-acetylmuramidase domain-containing protein [Muricoccus radiodurans]|uniref:N-acetylmuramidase domain-containing protein n=1 Tax=Muricoccus radiodurans TaxID=2231721 RepID=UPI003CE7EC80